MKTKGLLVIGFIAVVSMAFCQSSFAKGKIVFGGGPASGTFQVFANALQVYKPIQEASEFNVEAQSSAGSVENLRKTDAGIQQMSVVYSGHVYLGRNALMKDDTQIYENVLPVAWLYGAPAQLVVKKNSGITTVTDLVGKKVGVGSAGSGAYVNCELFFTYLDIWDRIERHALGYNDSAEAFGNNQLDAFWLFTAYPSSAGIIAAMANDIALVNVDADADLSGFYSTYPYFTKTIIPANTYEGVTYNSPSFQDSALWVANSTVSPDIVYEMLSLIYTDEGLAHIKAQKMTFEHMSVATGTDGIVTPFHPGAERFWREKGFTTEIKGDDIDEDSNGREQIEAFVSRFYEVVLGRATEPGGLNFWTNSLMNKTRAGADVAREFIFSQEFTNKQLDNSSYVDVLYSAFFNRQPDAGHAYWLGRLNNGEDRGTVLGGFIWSKEFSNLCQAYSINAVK